MTAARRIAVVGISGNGKTTVARRLAQKHGLRHVELDAIYHRAGWQQAPLDEFRAEVDEATRDGGWVVDGSYVGMVGDLTLGRADTIVWLDQPLPLVIFRLTRRAFRDLVTQRDLYNGNRQSFRFAFVGREALIPYAIAGHGERRRVWPTKLPTYGAEVVRLRSPREVDRWLESH